MFIKLPFLSYKINFLLVYKFFLFKSFHFFKKKKIYIKKKKKKKINKKNINFIQGKMKKVLFIFLILAVISC
jgi:hypothetical protein